MTLLNEVLKDLQRAVRETESEIKRMERQVAETKRYIERVSATGKASAPSANGNGASASASRYVRGRGPNRPEEERLAKPYPKGGEARAAYDDMKGWLESKGAPDSFTWKVAAERFDEFGRSAIMEAIRSCRKDGTIERRTREGKGYAYHVRKPVTVRPGEGVVN